MIRKRFLCLLGLLVVSLSLSFVGRRVEATVPNRPFDSTVLDEGGYLSSETIHQIDTENRAWAVTDQRLQVAVYVTNSLQQDLESFSNDLFRKWQVGFSGTDNGILLVIAIEDRAFRIETSDQAATVVTDVEARRLLDSSRPFFQAEDYNAGVLYLVDALGDSFYGTDRADSRLAAFEEENSSEDEGGIVPFLILIVILIALFSSKGGKGGGGSGLLWLLLSGASHSSRPSRHSHSSGSSGSFGGGGWSGGGGGGGGASSGW